MSTDPTKRFTERVDNYVKYRPAYPNEVFEFLEKECKLDNSAVIADIGSGTGIFSSLLLKRGYKVYAVEPNQAMQQAAKQWLGGNENHISVDATAEATTLPAKDVDLIVSAQAFHWFNAERSRFEFKRILKDDGRVALIWNNRLTDADDFSRAYEELLRNNTEDYVRVNHRNLGEVDFKAFFKNGEYKLVKYPNEQVFDLRGLMGRAFSSSYVPTQNSEAGQKFQLLLEDIFEKHNAAGKVSFKYQTEIYIGKL